MANLTIEELTNFFLEHKIPIRTKITVEEGDVIFPAVGLSWDTLGDTLLIRTDISIPKIAPLPFCEDCKFYDDGMCNNFTVISYADPINRQVSVPCSNERLPGMITRSGKQACGHEGRLYEPR